MKAETQIEIDGLDIDDEDDMETLQVMRDRSDVNPYVDPDTSKKLTEYLRDWRWRMSTFRVIEQEQIGRRSRLFAGERVFGG